MGKTHNQSFQFVPALAGLHRTAFSPLRYTKAAAEFWRYEYLGGIQ
jgi:hypothetical protein